MTNISPIRPRQLNRAVELAHSDLLKQVDVGIRAIALLYRNRKGEKWIKAKSNAVSALLKDLLEAAEAPFDFELPGNIPDEIRELIEAEVRRELVLRLSDFRAAFLSRLTELLGPPS